MRRTRTLALLLTTILPALPAAGAESSPALETPAGALTRWEISPAMPAEQVPQTEYPRFYAIFLTPWQAVGAEPDGWVNLSKPAASSPAAPKTVWARTTVRSDSKQQVGLSLGYSDRVSVFLNRRLLFTGRAGFAIHPQLASTEEPVQTLVLPIEPGLNEIFLVVTDSSGGGNFLAQADRELQPPLREPGKLTRAWETAEVFKTPESVLYDAERGVLYVSSFDKVDTRHVDTGFISRVAPTGEILELEWIAGLDGPCGMGIRDGKLYVAESFRGTLAEIDIDAGRVVARHAMPKGHVFLNDVAVDPAGRVYVSDTSRDWVAADVYRFSNGAVETWRGGYDLHRSNGVFIHRNRLFVGSSGEGLLRAFALDSGRMEVIAALGAGTLDGIRVDNAGNLLVSHWEGKVFQITPAGAVSELLDLREEGLNTADFELIRDQNLLVIPTFLGNRLVAYRLAD